MQVSVSGKGAGLKVGKVECLERELAIGRGMWGLVRGSEDGNVGAFCPRMDPGSLGGKAVMEDGVFSADKTVVEGAKLVLSEGFCDGFVGRDCPYVDGVMYMTVVDIAEGVCESDPACGEIVVGGGTEGGWKG